jgi:hypothetical protein
MQKPVFRRCYEPILLENLHKVAQGFHGVGIDEALGVEEGQNYLFCPRCMNFSLDGARLTLLLFPAYA